MELIHGRRGKEIYGGWAMNRGNQSLLLMLAMVASMAVVLVWEASPSASSNVAQSSIRNGVPDVADARSKPNYDSVKATSSSSPSSLEVGSIADLYSVTLDPADGQRLADLAEDGVKQLDAESIIVEEVTKVAEVDERFTTDNTNFAPEDKPLSSEAIVSEGENETQITTSEFAAVAPFESLQRSDKEALAVSESAEETIERNSKLQNATRELHREELTEELTGGSELEKQEGGIADEDMVDGNVLEEWDMGKPFKTDIAPLSDREILLVEGVNGSTRGTNQSSAMEAEVGNGANSSQNISPRGNNHSEKVCDYTVGTWVLDETRPLYSGRECKMWLSPDFACRLHNHPDKKMDRYRWQPTGCDLPSFNASGALEMLRNKVVAFVGDSLGRQQLQSLLCMLTRGKSDTAITSVGSLFNFYTPKGARKPNGFAYRFDATNTTIVFKWTVTLARVQPLNKSDPSTRNALHLDRPEQFLEDHLHQLDVVVLNTGHHWNGGKMRENKYDFFFQGQRVNKSSELLQVGIAYNATVHNVIKWANKNSKFFPEKIFYYRSLSPRHFRNGDWNTGGTCDTIRFESEKVVQEAKTVDPIAESAVVGATVHLLNITLLSLRRGETHVSKYGIGKGGQDCLHWCLPGIPDTWNEILLAELATKFKSS